jgi:cytochrome c oxidase assembly protein subunit 11
MSAQKNHKLVAAACGVFVASMLGAAYAAVPLYDMFCRMTGFGGTPMVATTAPNKRSDRVIRVRFDANVAPGLDWNFKPVQREMDVRVGDTVLAFYRAKNTSSRDQWGMASYNVAPDITGGYFAKMHCFCFEKQNLKAGEEMDMPVQFFIDPSIVDDASLKGLNTITLSYTFFAAEPPVVAGAKSAPKL